MPGGKYHTRQRGIRCTDQAVHGRLQPVYRQAGQGHEGGIRPSDGTLPGAYLH